MFVTLKKSNSQRITSPSFLRTRNSLVLNSITSTCLMVWSRVRPVLLLLWFLPLCTHSQPLSVCFLSLVLRVLDSVKPSIRAISPVSGSMNLPTNPTFVITFTKNIIPNTGLITFVGSKNTYSINVLSKEVQCKFNTCVIKPQTPFELGSYFMSFNTNAFRDTSDNLLAYNCNDYVFNVSGNACQLEYLKGGLGDTCNCMSTPTQCQCNCGETIFIKNYWLL